VTPDDGNIEGEGKTALGGAPRLTIDIGITEKAAKEIDADVASGRVGDNDGRAPGFGHGLLSPVSKRTVIPQRLELADKFSARTRCQLRGH
jgi:hypothetical protein